MDLRSRLRALGGVALLTALVLVASAAPAPFCPTGSAVLSAAAAPAATGDAPRTLRLVEKWRAGGDDDEMLYGAVLRVLEGPGGEIFVLDGQLSQVQVYGADGRHLRTLAREGEGPGEVRRPSDMFFTPDGKLALLQTFPGKVVLVAPKDGTPAGGWTFGAADPAAGSFAALPEAQSRGGNTVLIGIRMSFGQGPMMQQDMFVAAVDPEGKPRHTYLQKANPLDFSRFTMSEQGMDFPWGGRLALGPDGTVYLGAERDAYRIAVHAPDGKLVRTIERPYDAPPRKAEQKEVAKKGLEAIAANYPAPLQGVTVEDTDPAIDAMRVDDQGRLWVRTSRSLDECPAGVLSEFDVFGPDGAFQHRVRLAGPGNPRQDAVFLLPGGRVVVVTGARDAYLVMQGIKTVEGTEPPALEIVCYETRSE